MAGESHILRLTRLGNNELEQKNDFIILSETSDLLCLLSYRTYPKDFL